MEKLDLSYERLRDSFVGIRRQREHVQRLQPGQHVILIPGEPGPLAHVELADLRLDIPPLRPIAHDHQSDVARQSLHSLNQVAMALPAPQRRHDADETAL